MPFGARWTGITAMQACFGMNKHARSCAPRCRSACIPAREWRGARIGLAHQQATPLDVLQNVPLVQDAGSQCPALLPRSPAIGRHWHLHDCSMWLSRQRKVHWQQAEHARPARLGGQGVHGIMLSSGSSTPPWLRSFVWVTSISDFFWKALIRYAISSSRKVCCTVSSLLVSLTLD